MNNGFGINFLRYICEEDGSSWSQVFARLPFDEVELKQKGALFGVVKGKDKNNWADTEVEITNWVEEYFNGVETGGDLGDFFAKFEENYKEVDCLWLWLVLENGARKIKTVGKGDSRLVILRAEKNIDLSESVKNGKVVSGEIFEGDEIRMWLGGLGDNFESWETEVGGENASSFAAFKIAVGGMGKVASPPEADLPMAEDVSSQISGGEGDGFRVKPGMTDLVGEEKDDNGNKSVVENGDGLPQLEYEIRNDSGGVKIFENESLATDKFVGKLNLVFKIKNWFKGRRSERVGVTSVTERHHKKWPMVFGGLFLVLLVVSLFLGGVRKKTQEGEKKWQSFSDPINKSIDEAMGLVKLNPDGSKKLVEDARVAYNQRKTDFEQGVYKDKTDSLGKKIEDAWVSVSGEKGGQITEVVNLELIRAGVDANKMSYVEGGKLAVIGSVTGLVMSADTKLKEVKVVAGKGAGLGWIDVASNGSKYFVMNKGGVFVAGNESVSLVFDTAVTDPIGMSRFGANIYVLEKGNKEIFKFSVSETGFGERTRWLKEGQVMSVVPVDMDIDVDVWILGEGGQVERFRRGVKESFAISGLPSGSSFEKIAVEKEGDRIALLNAKSGTVVLCSKESGKCSQQLKTDRLKEVRDIEFDSENRLMVLFSGAIGVLN